MADQATDVAGRLGLAEPEALIAAAWLHDIGYAPALIKTGFHPLDGASFLQGKGQYRLAAFCAHHSCSEVEAGHRGLAAQLGAIVRPPAQLLDALTFCDMTSGPTGERVFFGERYEEIQKRYGPDHLVAQSITEARPALQAAVDRVAHAAYGTEAAQTRSKLDK